MMIRWMILMVQAVCLALACYGMLVIMMVMEREPETLTKKVIGDWVMSYHRGAGWYALFSAPIIGINQAAQEYWLKRNAEEACR